MKRILVPTDGSDCSGLAIEKAIEMAKLFGSKIILFNVYDIQHVSSYFDFQHQERVDSLCEDMAKQSLNILEKAKAMCADFSGEVETVSVTGNPAVQICEYVEKNDIDLVVMGSHGMGGIKRLFLGSVTHQVAVAIEKPILII